MKPGEEGRYANYLRIGHNAIEVVLEFGQLYPEETEVIHTRIITHPLYAKRFLHLLEDSLLKYEAQFGVIQVEEDLQ